MKALLIMFAGLGLGFWGLHEMWEHTNRADGIAAGKPFMIAAGVLIVIGAIMNHFDHIRRRDE